MYPFSCVLWAILRQIARYLPHHRSENASKTHPKSSHDKFKTASYIASGDHMHNPVQIVSCVGEALWICG